MRVRMLADGSWREGGGMLRWECVIRRYVRESTVLYITVQSECTGTSVADPDPG